MIRYTLKCDQNHRFDSWFDSSAGFDRLRDMGLLTCAVCGSTHVDKALMAPRLGGDDTAAPGPAVSDAGPAAPDAGPPALADAPAPAPELAEKIAALRAHIDTVSDDVGRAFATQARAMHDGDTPPRPIHGEAAPDEARALIEDGVPILPLPFLPKSKAN